MPNWCSNRVTFAGSTEDITNLMQFVQEKNEDGLNEFSFNSIIPMPEEIRGIASPVTAFKSKVEVDAYNANNANLPKAIHVGKAITHAKHKALLKKYGYAEWYGWTNEHWGTKWNANEVDVDDNHEDGLVVYHFDTPWCPPEPIYNALIAKYPEVQIQWFYEEPGMEFSGYLPN